MPFDLDFPVAIQDTVHIITKLRNRFLKPEIILPMGEFHVSTKFLEHVIENVPKDQHLLCKSDLDYEL